MLPQTPLHVLAVVGSLNQSSVTRIVITHVVHALKAAGCTVDLLDFVYEPLALFNPESSHTDKGFAELKNRVERADVFLLGTPDYHGSISSTMKNFLDHFWHEFAGKLFGTVVASHEKGLTVTDQLRTVARQCYAWTLPYGVSVMENTDIHDGKVTDLLGKRLARLARDLRIYGDVLARQRRVDLSGNEPGFLARYRQQD